MSNTHLNHEALLEKIRRDPLTAIARQNTIPAAATSSMLRISRKIFGIFDRQDQLEFSAELIHTLHYIAEHDYLAYLTLTKRFDLIRELFWDKELFAQQLYFIEQLEKEKEAQAKRDDLIFDQQRLALANRQKKNLTLEQQKLNEDKHLVAQELSHYFQVLEQNIHNEFFQKQILVYQEIYINQINRMQSALDLIKNDPTISAQDKQKFQSLLVNFEKQWSKITIINIHNADGSLNQTAAQSKYQLSQSLIHQSHSAFTQLLAQYPNHRNLQQVAQDQLASYQHFEARLAVNLSIRDQKLAEIKPHIKSTTENLKNEKVRLMEECIDLLEEQDLSILSKPQLLSYQKSICKLIQYKNSLHLADYNEHFSNQSIKFIKELKKLGANPEQRSLELLNTQDFIDRVSKAINPPPELLSLQSNPSKKIVTNMKNHLFFQKNEGITTQSKNLDDNLPNRRV